MRHSIINRLRRVWSGVFAPVGRRSSAVARRSRQFAIEFLEERVTPVLGAFDIPGPILAGEGFDGVARFNLASGALLSTARHLLTAAHTGSAGSTAASRFTVLGPNGAVNISTPGAGFIQHPNYLTGPANDYDIGVQPLAELGPLTAERWDIYTDSDEVGNVGSLVGYGGTGTGTIGHSTDVNPNQYWSTSTGQDTNYQVVRFTITGNPTGGFFTVQLGNDPATQNVPYNTSAATLANRLDALVGVNQVLVRLVGDTDFDGIVDNFGNPHHGSFEALFRGTTADNHDMPEISVTDSLVSGDIVVEKLLDGGSERIKTGGTNYVGAVSADGFRLYADFDDGTAAADVLGDGLGQGANEAYGTWGDSGSPLFIDGKIAGVLEGLYNNTPQGVDARGFDGLGGSGDFGQIDSWARVSAHLAFINDVLDDPFDLVLNMENQPWGNDGVADTISITRLNDQLRIHIGGVLRYTEDIGLIQSVTIRGSDDNETITVGALGGSIPIHVYGGIGNDTLRASAVAVGAEVTLDGGDGDDTIYAGVDNFDDQVRGDVIVHGGPGADTLYIDDTGDANQLVAVPDIYVVNAGSFYKPNPWSADVSFDNSIQIVRIDANPDDNAVFVNSTAAGIMVSVFGNGGTDSFAVGDGDFDAHILGDLLVHGGFGDDTLVIDDHGDGGNDNHLLGPDTYAKANAPTTLTYQFMQQVLLNTSAWDQTVDLSGTEEAVDVTINTQGGEDNVRVHAVHETSSVAINTGAGNDTIEFTPDSRNLSQVNGAVFVDAGAGASDDLILRDDGPTHGVTGSSYTVLAASFDASGFGSLSYSNVEVMELWADQLDDTINIHGLAVAVDLTVRGGAGDDLVQVGAGDLDSTIFGDLSVYGGDDDDTLQFNDGNDDFGNDSYLLSSNQFSKAGTQNWGYLQIENVVLNASAFNNTVQLSSLVPVKLTINAWLGDDTIELGTGRADLIQADIHVNGSLGNNVIHINNQDTPGGHTYTFAGQTFDMTGAFFDSLSYTSIDDVVLYAGEANDTIDVQSSVLSTDLEVFGNGGVDTVNVATGDVDAIGGDLVIHGGNDDDAAIINDQNDLGNDTYTVTTNQVSKPNFLLLYDGLEALTLNAGADDNTININSTLPGTAVIVNAGAGVDTIHLSPLALHLGQIHGVVTVNGQAGKDQVIAHDEVFALGALNPYTLTRVKVGRAGFGGLVFDTIERLQLNLGTGNDTVNVTEFNRDVLFALYGNGGADTFNVTVFPSALDTGGHLFIDGGSPKNKHNGDCLNVNYASKPKVPHKPKVRHKKSPPKRAGTISVDYPGALYDIQYKDVEKVKLAKL
jgi:hypothetical protein